MLKRKIKKAIIIFVTVILIIVSIKYSVRGEDGYNVGAFENVSANIPEVDNLIEKSSSTTISVIRVVAVVIAITMLLVIAMRYMISAPGDRADIKKHAIAYVVGAFILFGVTGILGILINIADSVNGNASSDVSP